MSAVSLRALKRWLAMEGGTPPAAFCQGCGAGLASKHLHVVDLTRRSFVCVCSLCSVSLTTRADSSYRALPERCVRLHPDTLAQSDWDALQIPVGIAFFFRNSALDTLVACYPSPAGAVESQLPLGDAPWMRALAPDVEALLVRRTHRANDCFLVPIDAGYELVGVIRREWKGLGGGPDVERAIDGFFGTLDRMSQAARA